MKDFNSKERDEVVTKGFLVDFLNKKLDSYVTKDYLDKKIKEQSFEFRQYIDVLMENQIHQIEILMEQMDDRYVLRTEWNSLNR